MAPSRVNNGWRHKRALWLTVSLIAFCAVGFVVSDEHSQDHRHTDEAPSFKYNKLANEPLPAAMQVHSQKASISDVWLKAIGTSALISAAPVLILLVIPLQNIDEHQQLLKFFSFASGGLLGNVFFHLISHPISPLSHKGGHRHTQSHSSRFMFSHVHLGHFMAMNALLLMSIIFFIVVEKFVKYLNGGNGGHRNSHSHAEDLKVAGYLLLAADFAFKFTHGLAIGASFMEGQTTGILSSVAVIVFLREIPHEIGGFAILLQSGCSKKKAVMLQLFTVTGAIMGTLCSFLTDGISDTATALILPFTAGGFIYIATVSIIPELLADSKIWQSVQELAAMLIGVYMMLASTVTLLGRAICNFIMVFALLAKDLAKGDNRVNIASQL